MQRSLSRLRGWWCHVPGNVLDYIPQTRHHPGYAAKANEPVAAARGVRV
jgi:hypothetical protein